MKRTLMNIILAIGSACVGAAGLHAQSGNIQANVPFAFQAANTTHAPGTYLVKRPSSPILILRNSRETTTTLLGIDQGSLSSSAGPHLTFHRYGNQYFLSEIWNQTGTKLPVSAREKELRGALAKSEMAVVTVACTPFATGL